MEVQAKNRIFDIFLGGLGGAIVSSILAVLLSIYFKSVENLEKVNARQEIIDAKELVLTEIRNARIAEQNYLLGAISDVEGARKKAADASITADLSEKKALEALNDVTNIKEEVEKFRQSIMSGEKDIANIVASIIEKSVLDKFSQTFFKGFVVAFEDQKCPEGWIPYDKVAGRVILGAGSGNNLSTRLFGEAGGEETHTLTVNEIPSHSHGYLDYYYYDQEKGPREFQTKPGDGAGTRKEALRTTNSMGGTKPHNNMPPFLVLQYCIKQ